MKSNEYLVNSLNIMHDQVKYAETKNSSIIFFTSALLIGFIASQNDIRNIITAVQDNFIDKTQIAYN